MKFPTAFLRCFAALLFTLPLAAQVVVAPAEPQIGSSNPVSAEPAVPHPDTKPCTVQLFQNLAFADYNPKHFSYAPPADCPGPWAKVVFTADFTVTAGRQFDRTASFYLGHANIFYGTTAEPRATLSPSWHVERDVTDLSAIFKSAQTGQADLGNFVGVSGGVDYTGIIYANAALEFYPASYRDPAPRVPDVVVPVNGPGGDQGTLNTTKDQITQTLNLPENTEKVYLDVIAQSQGGDEFWYLCVPNDQTSNLISCGNTAFRETEISIDGKPAGVAPVYPWIYTGGIDPYLWEPIPNVQTLDFKPYRVDLTPFAGLLADGSPHTVAVSVFNANSYFLATANLLAYTDHRVSKVTGGLLEDTLTAEPRPVVTENIAVDPTGQTYSGTVDVVSDRNFMVRGYVNTSHGRVETTVEQMVHFHNSQDLKVVNPSNPSTDIQNVHQISSVRSKTTTQDGPLTTSHEQHFSYPMQVDFSYIAKPDGSVVQTTTTDQHYIVRSLRSLLGFDLNYSKADEAVGSTDVLSIDAKGNLTSAGKTTGNYWSHDSLGHCIGRRVISVNRVLTSVTNGNDCDRDDRDRDDRDRDGHDRGDQDHR